MFNGVDVSKWNGNIDFNAVKEAGNSFVIIRAGYGNTIRQKDPKFEENYKKAKAAGLDVGAYWYSYATTAADAKKEAAACLQAIAGKKFEMPIYMDVEEGAQVANSAVLSAIIPAFMSELEKNRYFCGLYMSASYLRNFVPKNIKERYSIWVAHYSHTLKYDGAYDIWQYSSTGKIPRNSGNFDLNIMTRNLPEIITGKHFNGN